jgi:hypothetical protein
MVFIERKGLLRLEGIFARGMNPFLPVPLPCPLRLSLGSSVSPLTEVSALFNQEQIIYMQSIGLHMDFDHLSGEDFATIEDTVADRLQIRGFDEDYNVTPEGALCESILDVLPH